MPVHYIETGSTDPAINLAQEQFLLENKREGDWLMLWQNANTVVIGLNQNAVEEIDLNFVQAHGISVVRRMTGGGAVYHDLGNLNYSFITDLGEPGTLSIDRFTRPICRALGSMGVNASASGRNDIVVDGKKVSGVAQRIHRDRILHHGTLLFDTDGELLAGALRPDPEKFASKSAKSVRSRVGNLKDYLPAGAGLGDFWTRLLSELTTGGLIRESLTPEELEAVGRLADRRYRCWDWNYGRSPQYSFKNKMRFPGGSLDVRLDVREGRIASAAFLGDYMAAASNAPLCAALEGAKFDRESVSNLLSSFQLAPMFGAITADEILSCIFD